MRRSYAPVAVAAIALPLLTGCQDSGSASEATTYISMPSLPAAATADPAPDSDQTGDPTSTPPLVTASLPGMPVATPKALPTVGGSVHFQTAGAEGTMTLNSAKRLTQSPDGISGPPKNGTYLIVDVTLKVDDGEMTANPMFWKAQDEQGYTYTAELGGVVDRPIDSDTVPSGQLTRGELAFDVPTGPLTLRWNADGASPMATFAIPAS